MNPSKTSTFALVLCFRLTDSVVMIRYLAEFKTGAERKDAAENTMVAYKAAQVNNFLFHFLISVQFCLWSIMLVVFFSRHVLLQVFWKGVCGAFRTLLWLSLLQLTLLGLDWHLTSQCSTMRFSTHLIAPAVLQSRFVFQHHLMFC